MLSIHQESEENGYLHIVFSINKGSRQYRLRTSNIVLEDTDQINLGSLELFKTFPGSFPNKHTYTGNHFYGTLQISFKSFSYYQGGYIKFASTDQMCKENATVEAGTDDQASPVMCNTNYVVYDELKKCVKQNLFETTFCAHDMEEENSKCYRCPRGFGNKDFGPCKKCYDNCLACSGSLAEDCTYCDIGYGFIGSGCKLCDVKEETFDLVHNICQKYRQHNWDMNGDQDSYGGIQLYYEDLSAFANTKMHVENIFEKYWISSLSSNYYVLRKYKDIPRHRKVSIKMEFFLVDIRLYNNLFISVDNQYIKIYNAFEYDNSVAISGNFWGDLKNPYYQDWNFLSISLVDHNQDTMELGVVAFFDTLSTTYWLRDLQVDFFGCYPACSDCTVDNSPLDCTACEDGYYLSGTECKACSIVCKTCVTSPTNCLSCENSYLKSGSCVGKCDLGYFLDTNKECKLCPINCTQCTSLTNCIYCKKSYYLNSGSCLSCSLSCENCVETNNKCTSCFSPLLLQDNSCVGSCSAGYYQDNNICVKCGIGCAGCNATKCTSCLPGYKTKNNGCANPCGNGYFEKDLNTCQACSSKCLLCSVNENNCSKCVNGFYLEGFSCKICVSPCRTCNENNCLSCIDGFYFYLNSCLENCPDGFYKQNSICKECSPDCLTCENEHDFCISCHKGLFLNDHSCSSECKDGYFKLNDICCPNACQSCVNSKECTSCKTNYYLSEKLCLSCNENCQNCLEKNNCLECKNEYYLLEKNCVKKCPEEKYYVNETSRECMSCESTCKTCKGGSNEDCLSCYKNFVLYRNSCFECGPNSHFDLLDGNCTDKCGDGRRFTRESVPDLYSFNACDDGNQINGDGCSSDCQVEKNFVCKGGSPLGSDICREMILPTVKMEKIDDEHFLIIFSEDIILEEGSSLKDAIMLDIPKIKDKFLFDYEMTPRGGSQVNTFKEVLVKIDYKTSFENLEVLFNLNRSLLKDTSENKLRVIQLRDQISYNIPDRIFFEKATNTTSTIVSYSTYGLSFFNYFLGNYVTQAGLLSFFDFQRMISHIFINSKANTDLEYFLFGMNSHDKIYNNNLKVEEKNKKIELNNQEIVSNNNDKTNTQLTKSKVFEKNKKILEGRNLIGMIGNQINSDVKSFSIKMSSLLKQKQYFISLENLLFFFSCILVLISKIFFENRLNKKTRTLTKIYVYFSNRFFILCFFFNYQFFLRSALINTYNFSIKTNSETILSLMSLFLFFSLLLIPLFIFYILKTNIIFFWHPHFYYIYGFLYSFYKLNKIFSKAFFGLYFTKNVIYNLFLIFLVYHPVYQTFFIFFFNVLFLGLMIKIKPFINIYLFLFYILKEILESAILFLYFLMNVFDGKPQFYKTISIIILYSYLSWIFFIFFEFLFFIFSKIVYFFKRKDFKVIFDRKNYKKKLSKNLSAKIGEDNENNEMIEKNEELNNFDQIKEDTKELNKESEEKIEMNANKKSLHKIESEILNKLKYKPEVINDQENPFEMFLNKNKNTSDEEIKKDTKLVDIDSFNFDRKFK